MDAAFMKSRDCIALQTTSDTAKFRHASEHLVCNIRTTWVSRRGIR
jgi:hypothetical protein